MRKDELNRFKELENRYRPVAYAVKDLVPPLVPEVPATYVSAWRRPESPKPRKSSLEYCSVWWGRKSRPRFLSAAKAADGASRWRSGSPVPRIRLLPV